MLYSPFLDRGRCGCDDPFSGAYVIRTTFLSCLEARLLEPSRASIVLIVLPVFSFIYCCSIDLFLILSLQDKFCQKPVLQLG